MLEPSTPATMSDPRLPPAHRILKSPIALLLLVIALTLGFGRTRITDNLDRAFFDRLSLTFLNSFPPPTNAVLVLVDESSLKAVSDAGLSDRWPWPRELFAAMMASLHYAGATRVVWDFIFDEASRDQYQDDLIAAWSAAVPENIMAAHKYAGPLFWSDDFKKRFPEFRMDERYGHVNYTPDPDGVVRSYLMPGSLAARATDKAWPSAGRLLRWEASFEQLPARGVPTLAAFPFIVAGLKLVDAANAQMKSYDPRTLSRILPDLPADRLIPKETRAALNQVRGKVVFVGANAAKALDLRTTPVGTNQPGVMVHFTAWANARQNAFIRRANPPALFFASIAAPALVVLLGWRWRQLPVQLGVAALLEGVILGGSALAFVHGIFFPPVESCAGIVFGLIGITSQSFWQEERRRREIQQWFGSYVSREVVETLVRNPTALQLGGEKKELTVFFSDLAGFTDLSEKMEPEELLRLVNLYLSELSPCITENGGYLDKYIGDAIMGVFGSPTPLPNHAAAACQAALDSRERLEKLNQRLRQESAPHLVARVGINSGPMVVGNVGSEVKKNYTVIGDAVNLASRLEGANKEFGTSILLSEGTEAKIRGLFVTRPVSRLRVKGKKLPIQTHELIDLPGRLATEQQVFIDVYREGYDQFMKREFAIACERFEKALTLRPVDRLARLYLDKSAEFLNNPPDPDWDGVIQLTSK